MSSKKRSFQVTYQPRDCKWKWEEQIELDTEIGGYGSLPLTILTEQQVMNTLQRCINATLKTVMFDGVGPVDVSYVENTAADIYCVTAADGSCISTDPRCMHNQKIERG